MWASDMANGTSAASPAAFEGPSEADVSNRAAIGWLVLAEPLGGRRLISSSVILVGLVGLVVATL